MAEDGVAGDDLPLIAGALRGDQSAFRRLVLKYGDRMLAFCRSRTASDEDAADMAQDVFVRAFRSLPRFRLGASFPAWLFAIAANRARTGWARRAAERARFESWARAAAAEDRLAESRTDPAEEAWRRAEASALRDLVGRLPSGLRSAVELYYLAELDAGQTAEALGIGVEAVKSRLFRARKRMRAELEGRNGPGPTEVY